MNRREALKMAAAAIVGVISTRRQCGLWFDEESRISPDAFAMAIRNACRHAQTWGIADIPVYVGHYREAGK